MCLCLHVCMFMNSRGGVASMKQLFVDASSAASKAPYCVLFDIALHSYRHTFSSPPPPLILRCVPP